MNTEKYSGLISLLDGGLLWEKNNSQHRRVFPEGREPLPKTHYNPKTKADTARGYQYILLRGMLRPFQTFAAPGLPSPMERTPRPAINSPTRRDQGIEPLKNPTNIQNATSIITYRGKQQYLISRDRIVNSQDGLQTWCLCCRGLHGTTGL